MMEEDVERNDGDGKAEKKLRPLLANKLDHVLSAYKQFLAVLPTTKALTSVFRCCGTNKGTLLDVLRYATHLGT